MARHQIPRTPRPTGATDHHRRPAPAWRRAGLVLTVLLALQSLASQGVAVPLGRADPGAPAAGRGAPRVTAPLAHPARLAPRWQWPLEPRPAVARRFRPSPTPWGAGHRGVDLVARVGQPVRSAGAGVVGFSGVIAGQGVLTVQHAGGLRTTYQPVGERLPAGTPVSAGQRVGVIDVASGHCPPATCLHWGLLSGVGVAATYLDPLSLLGLDLSPPVLLPFAGPVPRAPVGFEQDIG